MPLLFARIAWITLALTLVVLTTWGLVRAYRDPLLVEMPPLTDLFIDLGLDFHLMITVALAVPFYAVVVIVFYVVAMRPRDPMALLFTATLLTTYSFASRALVTFEGIPVLEYASDVIFVMVAVLIALVFGLFPSGRFVPGWAWVLGPLMVIAFLLDPRMGSTVMTTMAGESALGWRRLVAIAVWIGSLGAGMVAQLYRYRHVSTIEERQQSKMVVTPLSLLFGVLLIALLVLALSTQPPGVWIAWVIFLAVPLNLVIPVCVAAAILRYRLFDVDRFISRTITYALVVAALGLTYFASVTVVTRFLPSQNSVAVAASTLAVAALFNPIRRRTQRAVDRRFNRSAVRSEKVAELFATEIGKTHSTEEIVEVWAGTVDDAFQPAAIGAWLRQRG
jgi:hypothetical protein